MSSEKALKALSDLYYGPEGFVGVGKLQRRLLQRGVVLSQEEILNWLPPS